MNSLANQVGAIIIAAMLVALVISLKIAAR
jgi:hypothetical protein